MDQQIMQLSESELLLFLGQSTRTTTMAAENVPEEAKQKQQNSADLLNPNWPFGTIGTGTDEIKLLKEKMAALEAKNRYLEGKVYSMDEKAKVKELNDKNKHNRTIAFNETLAKMVGEFKDELREENQRKMNELKDEFAGMLSQQNEEHQKQMAQLEKLNKASTKKAKKAEKTAEMAKNALEEVIRANQLKIAELTKEITLLKEEQEKSKLAIAEIIVTVKDELREQLQEKIDELKDEFVEMLSKQNESQPDLSSQSCLAEKKTNAVGKKVKKAEENAQIVKKLEESIQAFQQKMAELATEMALLKEQQQKTQIVKWVPFNFGRRVDNPKGNWMKVVAPPSRADGCHAWCWRKIAKKGFPLCRSDDFLGTIVYYYEVTQMSSEGSFDVGLSDRSADSVFDGQYSYSILKHCSRCFISGGHTFQWPEGATKPKCNGHGDVYGCGLLLGTKEELAIFFTLNGILLGQPIPISHPGVDMLYPTVTMDRFIVFEANFGEDAAEPFAYDIEKCPGMVFD